MGAELDASFLILRVALVLVCLVLQAVLYGWGLNLSHKAAYDTLLRLRTALQKRFEKLPLGVIQDKGTGTVKKLFVDDVDSLEVLLAHSMPEGIANLMVPIAVYVAMFFVDWKLALLSLASIPISLIAMMTMYSVGMKKMGPYQHIDDHGKLDGVLDSLHKQPRCEQAEEHRCRLILPVSQQQDKGNHRHRDHKGGVAI